MAAARPRPRTLALTLVYILFAIATLLVLGSCARADGLTDEGIRRRTDGQLIRINEGALLRGPHAGFLNGTAKIYLQHVRKAAGTTLCALLRANANATVGDCMPPNRVGGSGDVGRVFRSVNGVFGSLEEVASYLDNNRLEVVASENGHMPAFVDDHLGGTDPSWVFVTIMREPIGRILSSLHYEYKPLMKEWNEAVGAADPFTADKQKQLVYSHALGYLRWNRFRCKLDNYATRVFSHTCAKPKLTEQDYQLATRNLRRFDICFVSEWFAEMAPLVKYTLGMQFVDSAPRNVKGFLSGWNSGRAEVSPPLPRSRVAQRTSAKTDAVKFFGEDSDMLRHLRDLNEFDMRLYRVCKLHARELVDKYLFQR